jgi:hypothetical protein
MNVHKAHMRQVSGLNCELEDLYVAYKHQQNIIEKLKSAVERMKEALASARAKLQKQACLQQRIKAELKRRSIVLPLDLSEPSSSSDEELDGMINFVIQDLNTSSSIAHSTASPSKKSAMKTQTLEIKSTEIDTSALFSMAESMDFTMKPLRQRKRKCPYQSPHSHKETSVAPIIPNTPGIKTTLASAAPCEMSFFNCVRSVDNSCDVKKLTNSATEEKTRDRLVTCVRREKEGRGGTQCTCSSEVVTQALLLH